MVSIMRSEQTLRLIQLYHAHYPDIARNNQDADGRNAKLQMWARIGEELNCAYGTAFTVEQFKKKVQNVQCTSRQKLYSGKRNLGEAEVEYLRLFESDKISEQTLSQRSKGRRSVSSSASASSTMVAEMHQRQQRRMMNDEVEEAERQEEGGEEEELEGGSGTEEGGERSEEVAPGSMGDRGESDCGTTGDCGAAIAALSSLAALFGSEYSPPLPPPSQQSHPQQMDAATAQQLMMAMFGTTLNGVGGGGIENGNGSVGIGEGGAARRKRKMPEAVAEAAKRPRGAKEDGGGQGDQHQLMMGEEWRMTAANKHQVQQSAELPDTQQHPTQNGTINGHQQQKTHSRHIHQQEQSKQGPDPGPGLDKQGPNPGPESGSLIIPADNNNDRCQCSAIFTSLGRELCTRLDTTNTMLSQLVRLIGERWPPEMVENKSKEDR